MRECISWYTIVSSTIRIICGDDVVNNIIQCAYQRPTRAYRNINTHTHTNTGVYYERI